MSGGEKPIRMQEVAELAGVSIMTVSRVLRMPEKVAEASRKRVREAIETLGYVPDLAAGALSSMRSHFIVALIPMMNSSPFANTMQSLSSVLNESGYQLLIGTTDYALEKEESLVRTLLGHRPQGIVLTGRQHHPEVYKLLKRSGIPVVEIWDLPESPIDLAVGYSNFDCGVRLTEYLHARGRRKIGFALAEMRDDDRGEQRLQGYQETVRRLGLPERVVRAGQPPVTMELGGRLLRILLQEHPEVDSVICVSDTLAIGVLSECRKQGRTVPEDLAVVGFGDFEVAQHTAPPLTTIRVSGHEIGRQTAHLLLERLESGSPRRSQVEVSFELIERGSA